MERQGNSIRTFKQACIALLIMLTGILASAIFAVVLYLIYEVVVDRRDYYTLWIGIPGRLVALAICYYVAGVCGFLPIPEGWRLRWWPEPSFLLWQPQSWRKFFLSFYLLSPLSYMVNRVLRRRGMDTPETPLLYNRNEEQCYDGSPGSSVVIDEDATRRSTCGTPDINLHAESLSCSRSASHPPQDGEFRDFPPATPGPSWANVICEQDAPGGRSSVHSFNSPMVVQPASSRPRNRREDQFDIPKLAPFNLICGKVRGKTPNRTSHISQSSDDSFKSFDSSVDGEIVPNDRRRKIPYRTLDIHQSSDDSFKSFDSSVDGQIVPNDRRSKIPYRTSDIRQNSDDSFKSFDLYGSSNGSFKSFDSSVSGQTVPMAEGRSNKPPYIPYSSNSNSESSADGIADDALDNTESQDSHATSRRDTVEFMPANETDYDPRKHGLGVRLPDYFTIPWKWSSPSGWIPHLAAKVYKRNVLAEKRKIEKQTQGSRKNAMEDSQLDATSSAKESDGERSTDNDHSDPPERTCSNSSPATEE